MNFTDGQLRSVLGAWAASVDPREKAVAHNILFEERLGRQRLDDFEGSVGTPCATGYDLKTELTVFVGNYLEVPIPDVPATFRTENVSASMGPLSPEQKLVRLEDITRRLEGSRYTLAGLENSRASTDPAVSAMLESFLDDWNSVRDSRPAFAAIKDHVAPEFGDDDWPHKLRDRFGLAHYSGVGGALTVALMEYSVGEVLAEAARSPDIAHPFAFPTFLDSKPSAQFFPTPKELPAGVPMALFEIFSDDDLIAEVLHSRLSYAPHHVARFGQITLGLPSVGFRSLRNNHLAALQVAALRADFGEEV